MAVQTDEPWTIPVGARVLVVKEVQDVRFETSAVIGSYNDTIYPPNIYAMSEQGIALYLFQTGVKVTDFVVVWEPDDPIIPWTCVPPLVSPEVIENTPEIPIPDPIPEVE